MGKQGVLEMEFESGADGTATGRHAPVGSRYEAADAGRHCVETEARVEDGEAARDGPRLVG